MRLKQQERKYQDGRTPPSCQCVPHPALLLIQQHNDIIKLCFGITAPGYVERGFLYSFTCKIYTFKIINEKWLAVGHMRKKTPSVAWTLAGFFLRFWVKWEIIWDTSLALPCCVPVAHPFQVADIYSVICHLNGSREILSIDIWFRGIRMSKANQSTYSKRHTGAIKETVQMAWEGFWQEFKSSDTFLIYYVRLQSCWLLVSQCGQGLFYRCARLPPCCC